MKNITYRELLQTLKDYEGSPCDDILDQPITIRIDRGGVSQETRYVNNNDFDGRYILVAEVDLAADYGITTTAVLDRNRDEQFIGHTMGHE